MKTQERHPFPATTYQIINLINYEIKKNNYSKIFLVTEESKYLKILKKTQILALLVTGIWLPLIQIKEIIFSAPYKGVASYSVQSSIWDVFGGHTWVYRFQPLLAPIASGFQPVLRLFNEAGSRTEFFNSIFLVVILGFVLINRTKELVEKKLAMRVLYSSIFSIFCLGICFTYIYIY